jgi:hypothetical protein
VVPAGSTIRYVAQWRVTPGTYLSGSFNPTPDGILSDVASRLENQGLHVRDSSIHAPDITAQVLAFGFYPFQVTLSIQTSGEFNDVQDVVAVVNHEVFEITGELPTSSSAPEVTPPGGRPRPTGQPKPSDQPKGGLFEWLGTSFKDFFSGLGTVGVVVMILLAAVVVTVFAFGIKGGI